MTTVAEMIEWMKTLPQDAEVECGVEVRGSYECWMDFRAVDIESCDVLDYTSEDWMDEESRKRYPTMAGKVIVMIQGE
jgi:hypothetical protein